MRNKSLKKNLFYQTFYQILITITPIITSPYLSRVLGAEKLGVYSFSYSIISYFILFAMMGINNYGTRTIAQSSNSEKNQTLNEIYSMQLLSTLISIVLFAFLFIFIKTNIFVLLAQFFWLLGCVFNVDWYYFGCEEIKPTVIRNTIIKILTIVLILTIIKNPLDIVKYTLIMSVGDFISKLVMFIGVFKKNKFVFAKFKNIKKHIKPNLVLFIPLLAMSIFHLTDKTMLGIFSTYEETGFYYNSDKLINIPLGIITGLGTIMLSRCSYLIKNGDKEGLLDLVSKSFDAFIFVICAFSFGISAVSKEFIPLFFGKGYDKCILLTILLSIVMIFKTLQCIFTNQLLVPLKKDHIFIKSVIIGAGVNIILNSLFIICFKLGSLGAVIGTIVAEFFVCFYQLVYICKHYHLLKNILKSTCYILFGMIMFLSVFYIDSFISYSTLITFMIKVAIGSIIYLLLSFVYWIITKNDNFRFILRILRKNN